MGETNNAIKESRHCQVTKINRQTHKQRLIDTEIASCVEADDSELIHVSQQTGFLLGQQLIPTNTLLQIKTNIDGKEKHSTKQGYQRNKGTRKKRLSNSLIFEQAIGLIFHLPTAPSCNQKYFRYKILNLSKPFYSSLLSLYSLKKIYQVMLPSVRDWKGSTNSQQQDPNEHSSSPRCFTPLNRYTSGSVFCSCGWALHKPMSHTP